jgi:hypothetical protein
LLACPLRAPRTYFLTSAPCCRPQARERNIPRRESCRARIRRHRPSDHERVHNTVLASQRSCARDPECRTTVHWPRSRRMDACF